MYLLKPKFLKIFILLVLVVKSITTFSQIKEIIINPIVINPLPVITYYPKVTIQPQNVTFCYNTTTNAFFTFSSNCSTFKWQWSVDKGATWTDIAGATNDTLIIKPLSSKISKLGTLYYWATSNSRLLRCLAGNKYGTVYTNTVELYIKPYPSITSQPASVSRIEGETATLNVGATGSSDISYQWYKNSILINGAISATYTLPNVSLSDAGNYYCVIANSCKSITSNTVALNVKSAKDGWIASAPAPVNQDIKDVVFTSNNNGWAITPDYISTKILKTTDGGLTWVQSADVTKNAISTNWLSLSSPDANHVFLISSTYITHTDNGGTSWDTIKYTLPGGKTFTDISFVNANLGYIVGSQGFACMLERVGAYWKTTVLTTNTTVNLNSVKFFDINNGWACGTNNIILKTTNGGANWTKIESNSFNVGAVFSDIYFTDALNGWVVGNNIVGYTNNGGDTWVNAYQVGMLSNILSVYSTNANNVWISGFDNNGNNVMHSVDGGKTWVYQTVGLNGGNIHKVFFFDSENGICVGTSGKSYLTDYGGCLFPSANLFGSKYKCSNAVEVLNVDTLWRNLNKGCTYLWTPGNTTGGTLNVNTTGTYTVTVTNQCGNDSSTDSVKVTIYNPISILKSTDTVTCKGTPVQLWATGGNSYNWSPATYLSSTTISNPTFSNNNISENTSYTYNVTVTDTNNCSGSVQVKVMVTTPPVTNICLVTIDTTIQKNMLVWSRPNAKNIMGYRILREGGNIGVYDTIGFVPYKAQYNLFVDTLSNPRQQQYLYKLQTIDSCGNLAMPSPYHKTMRLTYAKSGDGEGYELQWYKYEIEGTANNFTRYIIYGGTDSTKLDSIYGVSASLNSWKDVKSSQNQLYFYRVAGVLSSACTAHNSNLKASAGPFLQSVSNLEDNRLKFEFDNITSISNIQSVTVYPNPTSGAFQIKINALFETSVNISLYNVYGQQVQAFNNINLISGIYTVKLNTNNFAEGQYYIKVESKNGVYFSKVMVVK